jgi:hypothetical protein
MTNLDVANNTSSRQAPVVTVEDRFEYALGIAYRLDDMVAQFKAEAAELFSELKSLGEDATISNNNDLGCAIDAAAWLINALGNVEGECMALVDHLTDATPA